MTIAAFALWLMLFGGGIIIDTEPYRRAISPAGVAALAGDSQSAPSGATGASPPASTDSGSPGASDSAPEDSRRAWVILGSSIVTFFWFLPLNLALLCAVSGILGSFGNRANLHSEDVKRDQGDESNPHISALLRGFFVYLIVISGLLLLDDDPFSNSTPGQYIRLAGFLSLFSFVVNYQPRLFGSLLTRAVERFESQKDGQNPTVRTSIQYREREIEASVDSVESIPEDDGPELIEHLTAASETDAPSLRHPEK